jgi:LysM repeat protein
VRRYAGPAAFLLTVTLAVVLVRAGLHTGGGHHSSLPPAPARATTTVRRVTTTRKATPAKRYWIVRAGDTFGVIAAKSGVSVATIQQLNPNVASTSLVIGERLRIR